MKRFAIPAISLAALMASGIAFAQNTPDQQPSTQPSQEMQQKQDPATQAPAAPEPSQSSEQPKADTTAQQPTPSDTNLAVTVDAGVRYTTTIAGTPVRFRLNGHNLTNAFSITPQVSGQIMASEARRVEFTVAADF